MTYREIPKSSGSPMYMHLKTCDNKPSRAVEEAKVKSFLPGQVFLNNNNILAPQTKNKLSLPD